MSVPTASNPTVVLAVDTAAPGPGSLMNITWGHPRGGSEWQATLSVDGVYEAHMVFNTQSVQHSDHAHTSSDVRERNRAMLLAYDTARKAKITSHWSLDDDGKSVIILIGPACADHFLAASYRPSKNAPTERYFNTQDPEKIEKIEKRFEEIESNHEKTETAKTDTPTLDVEEVKK